MINPQIIDWLLDSDVSLQYQVYRDLLDLERPDLQMLIAETGWGAKFLSFRNANNHWGRGFYAPKWTSSHYTLLDLRQLCIYSENELIRETIRMIANEEKGKDGGINPSGTITESDVCINGMFLNYASYFRVGEELLKSVVDFIITQQLPDGGFNCRFNRSGAHHSSLHSTLCVIEGINEYAQNGYSYRVDELKKMELVSREFILAHRLFKSDKTGCIIDRKMLMLSYPLRWRYDILRSLDYFRLSNTSFDDRMTDAIDVLKNKQRTDEKWPLQARHTGEVHFDMEQPGKASKWNTLRALRVLRYFNRFNS